MRKRTLGILFVLLALGQFFSPWMLEFGSGIKIVTSTAEASTTSYIDFTTGTTSTGSADAVVMVTEAEDGYFTATILTKDIVSFKEDTTKATFNAYKKDGSLIVSKKLSEITATNVHLTTMTDPALPADAELYLRKDYIVKDKAFDPDLIDDDGYYTINFSLEKEGVTKSFSYISVKGDEVDEDADSIWEGDKNPSVPYIAIKKGPGNSFNLVYGQVKAQKPTGNINSTFCGRAEITGETSQTVGLQAQEDSSPAFENGAIYEPLEIDFKGTGKKTVHLITCTYVLDSDVFPPKKATGEYSITTNLTTINLKKITTTLNRSLGSNFKFTWTAVHNLSKAGNEIFSDDTDWEFRDYSIKEFKPAYGDENKLVLDTTIALYISRNESNGFAQWVDRDGNGEASDGDEPNDWQDFLGSKENPEIDTRPAKDGYGFYLIYSSTNKDVQVDTAEGEVNLNEYIFGKKTGGASPIIQGKNGMSFVAAIPNIELGKTYYIRLYVNERDSGADDDEYTSVISFSVPTSVDLSQISRDGIVTNDGEELDNDLSWLGECNAWPSTWFTGCLLRTFYYIFWVPSAYLLALTGTILDYFLAYSISPTAYKAAYIIDGWRFIRDVCNLFFIFILVYLAFKIILGIGHGTKQLIVNTLIIATVINFSYPLTAVIIDASNITARQFYYNAFKRTNEETGKPIGLSATIVEAFNPQKLVMSSLESSATGNDPDQNKGSTFMILLLMVVINVLTMIMFLRIALQFVFRIVGLIFALVLSPLAVFSFSLDEKQRGKMKMVGFENWMSGLLNDAFKAPVFLFFMLLLGLFVGSNPFKAAANANGIEWWLSFLLPFILIMALLQIMLSVTKSMTSSVAEMAGGFINKGVAAVAGVGMGIATGGASMLGRSTIGKFAAGQAEKMRSSGAKDTWWNRAKLRAFDSTAKSSFDLRQTAAGNALSKETGMNMNAGTAALDKVTGFFGKPIGISTGLTAGGYIAQKDRMRQRMIDRGKLWKHNEKLEEDLNHEKEHKEGEVKDLETKQSLNDATIKELTAELKNNTEALEKSEKAINSRYDDEIREHNATIQREDGNISSLSAQIAAEKDDEKRGILSSNLAAATNARLNAINAKNDAEKNKKEELRKLKDESDLGKKNTELKNNVNSAKEEDAELSKEKAELKKEIGSLEKGIKKVKNDRMLKATLDYKRKKTGDKTQIKSYGEVYTEKNGGDEAKAEAQGIKDFGDNWEKMKDVNHSGYTIDKSGHKHEVTHMVDEHFHPENFKNNYKEPKGGGGMKTHTSEHTESGDHNHH